MQRVNNEIFRRVRKEDVRQSTFDLSNHRVLSMDMGYLIPVQTLEMLPGDKVELKNEHMIKFSPLISPAYGRMNCYVDNFYVPYRILFEDPKWWDKFITKREELTLPSVNFKDCTISIGSIGDYLGLPLGANSDDYNQRINVLPLMVYYKIYNDFYRDVDLQTEIDYHNYNETNYIAALNQSPYQANYEKDYFTSCKPFAQKISPEQAEVIVNLRTQSRVIDAAVGMAQGQNIQEGAAVSGQTGAVHFIEDGTTQDLLQIDNIEDAYVLVSEMRRAEAMQQVLEKLNRSGQRYKEWLMAFFGVEVSDKSLDMPQFIGGYKKPVIISETLNTSDTLNAPQGNQSGNGISVGNSDNYYFEAEEHGMLMTILYVLPQAQYYEGLNRMWSRQIDLDYPIPELAELGEQEVYKKEVKYMDDSAHDELVFGYIPRYSEWKYGISSVHGEFRDTLEFWHVGRKMQAGAPVLNGTFLRVYKSDYERIFAVPSIPSTKMLYVQVYNQTRAKRALPYYVNAQIG